LTLAYPERNFTFVEIDKYQGAGSSLAYTMLKAKEHLQCPFIFHAGDTVVLEPVPAPLNFNWNGGFKGGSTANYRSFTELDDKVYGFNDKGASDYDYIHIGLVGIKDYEKFWAALEEIYKENPENPALGDVPVLQKLIRSGCDFIPQQFKTWLDIGNIEALNNARKRLGEHLVNLDKPEEATYIFEDSVIKFMSDPQVVSDRVKREESLKGLVPQMQGATEHFYKYRFSVGKLYSRVVTPKDFSNFLLWTDTNLWKEEKEATAEEFKKICLDFYEAKTKKRIQQFYDTTGMQDMELVINGEEILPLSQLLEQVDFNKLSDGKQTGFHGDFILDNIIRTPDGYTLLDWRQNFGGLLKGGDMYYDLAKLNHNLTVNHDIVFSNLFTLKVRGSTITCDILRSDNLLNCQKLLWEFILKKGLDLKKVKLLTSLIWLNSAPLHHHPYNLFLHYFGRLNLHKALKET
ncbi:MAG TPA: hypothetical protein VE973_04010, partial [Candidatus Limnocylindria bacterium]|nr:hypothetical protein [Candidatus Limnocylindria bacterium]